MKTENGDQSRHSKMRFLWALVLLSLSLSGLPGCGHKDKEDDKKNESNVRVRVQAAAERTLAVRVAGLGRCEAIPGRYATLTAAAEGRVVQFLKLPGETVEAGEAIVQLDTMIAGNSLAEKRASLESQKLAIDQAQLTLKKAQVAVNKLKPLRQRNEISETTMYDAGSALEQADLQEQAAKAQYRMAEAAVATAKAQLAQLTISTPIAGVLNGLSCQLGQTLSVGTSVGEVVDAGQLRAVVWLPVPDARQVKTGQSATVRACGSSLDERTPESDAPGTVLDVGAVTDPQTGNVPVRIKIDNSARRLRLGQAVMATIVVREEKSLAVPAEAVRDTGDEAVMLVVRDGKTAMLHPKLGLKDDGWIAVHDTDLKPGEPVIVEGGYGLDNGVEVEVEKADGAEAPHSGGNKEKDRLKPELQQTESDK